ncbi:hypothetical protein ADUPG1_011328 [Aduncisulcus paluster]|uniref:Dynamin N-terminal domain-containing protein n=1 Tax=Aduncisulcus paluster TaxID=2918883 RepID=A0ABQ5JV74_9EUKA|nr:hypothetical protein ADUPG1_011328 [Aduncisulcus paluster]
MDIVEEYRRFEEFFKAKLCPKFDQLDFKPPPPPNSTYFTIAVIGGSKVGKTSIIESLLKFDQLAVAQRRHSAPFSLILCGKSFMDLPFDTASQNITIAPIIKNIDFGEEYEQPNELIRVIVVPEDQVSPQFHNVCFLETPALSHDEKMNELVKKVAKQVCNISLTVLRANEVLSTAALQTISSLSVSLEKRMIYTVTALDMFKNEFDRLNAFANVIQTVTSGVSQAFKTRYLKEKKSEGKGKSSVSPLQSLTFFPCVTPCGWDRDFPTNSLAGIEGFKRLRHALLEKRANDFRLDRMIYTVTALDMFKNEFDRLNAFANVIQTVTSGVSQAFKTRYLKEKKSEGKGKSSVSPLQSLTFFPCVTPCGWDRDFPTNSLAGIEGFKRLRHALLEKRANDFRLDVARITLITQKVKAILKEMLDRSSDATMQRYRTLKHFRMFVLFAFVLLSILFACVLLIGKGGLFTGLVTSSLDNPLKDLVKSYPQLKEITKYLTMSPMITYGIEGTIVFLISFIVFFSIYVTFSRKHVKNVLPESKEDEYKGVYEDLTSNILVELQAFEEKSHTVEIDSSYDIRMPSIVSSPGHGSPIQSVQGVSTSTLIGQAFDSTEPFSAVPRAVSHRSSTSGNHSPTLGHELSMERRRKNPLDAPSGSQHQSRSPSEKMESEEEHPEEQEIIGEDDEEESSKEESSSAH